MRSIRGKTVDEAENALGTFFTVRFAITSLLDGVLLRTKRRKCAVSGCEIPARARLGRRNDSWFVCGVHRKPVAEMLNEATVRYVDACNGASRSFTAEIINGLDAMADHSKELALAT